MNRRGLKRNEGFILISGYLTLAVFLLYSNALAMRTVTQGVSADRFREKVQALDLAGAAVEQLREDLNRFLTVEIYSWTAQGNAVWALDWLDKLGTNTEDPPFDFPNADTNNDGTITWADATDGIRDGTTANPRCVTDLATVKKTAAACFPTTQDAEAPRAWIVKIERVDPADPLSTRRVTMEAEAKVGSVTKRIQATYEIELMMSDIFRYAYFINNYGWFDLSNSTYMRVNGDIRTNGDLAFTKNGTAWLKSERTDVNGDLYASLNPELINPKTLQLSMGTIKGDPGQYLTGWAKDEYYWSKDRPSRPERKLIFSGQPAPGGKAPTLPLGYGYDTEYRNPTTGKPDQRRFESQASTPMPYIGDLDFYKTLATRKSSSLTYYDATTGEQKTVRAVSTDQKPLVLVGTQDRPIVIDGPVVIQGDVVIKGVFKGRGTLYAGRNVHVVGDILHAANDAPTWPSLQRNVNTGQIREVVGRTWIRGQIKGTVCDDGAFYDLGQQAPTGCVGKK